MERQITIEEMVQIFCSRREELRRFKERVYEEISDSRERAITEFSQKTFDLNDRLVKLFEKKLL